VSALFQTSSGSSWPILQRLSYNSRELPDGAVSLPCDSGCDRALPAGDIRQSYRGVAHEGADCYLSYSDSYDASDASFPITLSTSCPIFSQSVCRPSAEVR